MTKFLFIASLILGISYQAATAIHGLVPNVEQHEKEKIQVALLLDTSNSMDGLIEQAKSQLWKMVNTLANATKDGVKPSIEIALYEYGNDRLSEKNGFIRVVEPLTNDLDQISEQLFRLKTNGGDEYCGWVTLHAVQELNWTSDTGLKMIIIAGNESYEQGPKDFRIACEKAKKKGIIINTIFCGNYDNGVDKQWKAGATCSNGKYININQDDKVSHIPTPYDDDIIRLNKKLNKTYFGYGSLGHSKKANQISQDINAMTYGAANARTRASFKSKKAYSNSSWDVVDAVKENKKEISDFDDNELPEEMKGMSLDEKESFIKSKIEERETIQKEISELSDKAEKFIAEQRKKDSEVQTLDEVLIKTMKEQAEKAGYEF